MPLDGLDGLARIGSDAPLGRAAQPEEMAPTYVYLASDADSSYTVGEVIAVTGEWSTPGNGPHAGRHPASRIA